jgi:aromatic-amino-acid transaminase
MYDWRVPVLCGSIEDLEGRYHGFPLLAGERTFNLDALAHGLQQVPAGGTAALILNTPCHNPTGYSLTAEDWRGLRELVWRHADAGKTLSLLLDPAYVDFHWHEPHALQEEIVLPLLPLHARVTLAIGWTISKTFLAYGQRLGTLLMLASTPEQTADLQQRMYRLGGRAPPGIGQDGVRAGLFRLGQGGGRGPGGG